jgi:hypothetical protein
MHGTGIPSQTSNINLGIWLSHGPYDNVRVQENIVRKTQTALEFGKNQGSAGPVFVTGNTFTNSVNDGAGQITIKAEAGQTVQGDLIQNRIEDGEGFGIFCTEAGTNQLSNLTSNAFTNNKQGDKSPTCL